MEKIRIVLVDDHLLIRDGIKALLGGINDIEIVGEAGNAVELFEILPKLQPVLLVMDISLPGMSGIEITKKVCIEYPEVKVLILSMYNSEDFIYNSIKAGAKGFLPKNTTRNELLEAIYAISCGEGYYSDSVSKVIMQGFIRKATGSDVRDPGSPDLLTEREREILKLYVEGYINREISEKLDISIRTVETHKSHIMRKLGLKSTVEMVKFAIKNKIIDI